MSKAIEIIIEQMVKAYSNADYLVYDAGLDNGDTDAAWDDMRDLEEAAEALGYYFERDGHGYWKAVKYECRPVRLDEQDNGLDCETAYLRQYCI